jgi:signal transduction histidine kinase
MKLKNKIILIMSLLAVSILVLASSIYSYWIYENKLEDIKGSLLKLARYSDFDISRQFEYEIGVAKSFVVNSDLIETLQKTNQNLSNLSNQELKDFKKTYNAKWMNSKSKDDEFVKPYLNNDVANYFKKQQKLFKNHYGEIFLTNKHGVLVASTGKLTTFIHANKYWWENAYENKKVFIDDRGYDDSVGDYVIGIVVPIIKDKEVIGVLKCNVMIKKYLKDLIEKINNIHNIDLKIVRTKGLIVLEKAKEPLSSKIYPEILDDLKHKKTGIKFIDDDKLVAFGPIDLSKDILFGGKPNSIDHKLGNENEIWHVVLEKDNITMSSINKDTNLFLLYMVLFTTILLVFLSVLLGDYIIEPIKELSNKVKSIHKGTLNIDIQSSRKDELGILANSFHDLLENLKVTTTSRDKLQEEIEKREKIQRELDSKKELLIAQSRHAAMGEMISMIAHQWRQPLSIVAMESNNLLIDLELDENIKKEDIEAYIKGILKEIQYLSDTIDDFRNFFMPNNKTSHERLVDIFNETQKIIGKSLEAHDVRLDVNCSKDIIINTYKNDLIQVFINIINNAKEAYIQNKLENKTIRIDTKTLQNDVEIKICDDAGGIKSDIIQKIFDPYFSTKDKKTGTGLGLYMCKIIVEQHLKGTIRVENRQNGACFVILIPKS